MIETELIPLKKYKRYVVDLGEAITSNRSENTLMLQEVEKFFGRSYFCNVNEWLYSKFDHIAVSELNPHLLTGIARGNNLKAELRRGDKILIPYRDMLKINGEYKGALENMKTQERAFNEELL